MTGGRVPAALALLAVAAAACAGDAAPDGGAASTLATSTLATSTLAESTLATSTPAAPILGAADFDDVGVTVFRNRADDLQGVFTVKVDNTAGAGPLAVDSVALDTAAYRTGGPVEVATSVAAGLRVDLEVPVGPPACTPGAAAPTAAVRLVLGRDGDPARAEVTREVDAADLVRWNGRECAAAEAAELSGAALVGPWVPVTTPEGRLVSEGTLHLEVPADAPAPVTVVKVERTVILAPLDLPLPATLAPGESLDLTVRLASGRCDPHAVADQKYGFVFPVRVAVGDAEAVALPVTVPPDERAPIFDMILESCGLS